MERGFWVDAPKLKDLKDFYDEKLLNLQKEIEKNLGKRLRPNSNKELGELLFGLLDLPPLRKTRKYLDSVSISVLGRLLELYGTSHPFLGAPVKFRRIQPLGSFLLEEQKAIDLQLSMNLANWD